MDESVLQFISPVAKFAVTGPPIKPKKMKENGKVNEGGDAMIIFDFNEKKNQHDGMTVEEDVLRCAGTEVSGVLFRNYPMLRIDDFKVADCHFENCKTVYFSDCTVRESKFVGIETLYADRTSLSDCSFRDLFCDNDCILSLEDSNITACTFQNVQLTNEAYLVNGVGDVWVENSCFENISTDRRDLELFFCEEIRGRIFKKKKQFCIVDHESCTGLDRIQCSLAEETEEDERLKLLRHAVELEQLPAVRAIKVCTYRDCCAAGDWDEEILVKPLSWLDFSVRTFNCLARAGYQTVEDLARADLKQILQTRNLGKNTATEIARVLQEKRINGTSWENFL